MAYKCFFLTKDEDPPPINPLDMVLTTPPKGFFHLGDHVVYLHRIVDFLFFYLFSYHFGSLVAYLSFYCHLFDTWPGLASMILHLLF